MRRGWFESEMALLFPSYLFRSPLTKHPVYVYNSGVDTFLLYLSWICTVMVFESGGGGVAPQQTAHPGILLKYNTSRLSSLAIQETSGRSHTAIYSFIILLVLFPPTNIIFIVAKPKAVIYHFDHPPYLRH